MLRIWLVVCRGVSGLVRENFRREAGVRSRIIGPIFRKVQRDQQWELFALVYFSILIIGMTSPCIAQAGHSHDVSPPDQAATATKKTGDGEPSSEGTPAVVVNDNGGEFCWVRL